MTQIYNSHLCTFTQHIHIVFANGRFLGDPLPRAHKIYYTVQKGNNRPKPSNNKNGASLHPFPPCTNY